MSRPHSMGQSSVTCPHLTVREVGKVCELRKKRDRFEEPIAVSATGFYRLHRAMLSNVVATSHVGLLSY